MNENINKFNFTNNLEKGKNQSRGEPIRSQTISDIKNSIMLKK